MASNERDGCAVIAKREYLVIREGKQISYSVALTAPHGASKSITAEDGAACTVFIAPENPEGREVHGRDHMEALCHAILAIEARLIFLSRRGELFNLDGSRAEVEDFGMFFGIIGKQYQDGIQEDIDL